MKTRDRTVLRLGEVIANRRDVLLLVVDPDDGTVIEASARGSSWSCGWPSELAGRDLGRLLPPAAGEQIRGALRCLQADPTRTLDVIVDSRGGPAGTVERFIMWPSSGWEVLVLVTWVGRVAGSRTAAPSAARRYLDA